MFSNSRSMTIPDPFIFDNQKLFSLLQFRHDKIVTREEKYQLTIIYLILYFLASHTLRKNQMRICLKNEHFDAHYVATNVRISNNTHSMLRNNCIYNVKISLMLCFEDLTKYYVIDILNLV